MERLHGLSIVRVIVRYLSLYGVQGDSVFGHNEEKIPDEPFVAEAGRLAWLLLHYLDTKPYLEVPKVCKLPGLCCAMQHDISASSLL